MSNPIADISQSPVSGRERDRSFEKSYIRLRMKEERIYSDNELLRLPDTDPSHRYAAEWRLRKKSAMALRSYLAEKKKPLHILEAGCGNGWLSHFLAQVPLSTITGADINSTELLQAGRVFGHVSNLRFLYGTVCDDLFAENELDEIIFASSIQYCASLPETVSHCFRLLKQGGLIHFIDSPFYTRENAARAKERSLRYFDSMGISGMGEFYHHHCVEDLASFSCRYLYKPGWLHRYRNDNPFPWICIAKP